MPSSKTSKSAGARVQTAPTRKAGRAATTALKPPTTAHGKKAAAKGAAAKKAVGKKAVAKKAAAKKAAAAHAAGFPPALFTEGLMPTPLAGVAPVLEGDRWAQRLGLESRRWPGAKVDDLVRAVDAASLFIASASQEIRERVGKAMVRSKSRSRALATPSLLAHAGSTVMQAIVGDEHLRQRVAELERAVQFTVSPRTQSGLRLRSMRGRVYEVPLADLRPASSAMDQTVEALRKAGFEIMRVGRFGVTVRGHARLAADVLGVPLTVSAISRPDGHRATRMFSGESAPPRPSDLFVAPTESLSIDGSRLHEAIDDFVFIPPPMLLAPASKAPGVSYPHLDDRSVRALLGAPTTGSPHSGLTGKGVTVAMIDTGFDTSHPYYASRGYDFEAVDTTLGPNASTDPNGHGTAMAWNALAIAPGCSLRGYKYTDIAAAIEDAADAKAQVVSCSWGYDREQSFPQIEASIRSVIEDDGVITLFAAGNGQQCWPACMPEVFAIGGAYADPVTHALQASDYASGFRSNLYPDRIVPDFSGLCGSSPSGVYLPLPVPAGSVLDRELGGASFPDKDETTTEDGWVYASGTSSATPQVAGVIALMLEHARKTGKTLTTSQVKTCLQRSAQPIQSGRNAFGFPAIGHPNVAVGWGLVNISAALAQVDLL